MAMKTCGHCRKQYRKGRIAFVAENGTLKSTRVCPHCADDAVLIVTGDLAVRCDCNKFATVCGPCVDKRVDEAKRVTADAPALAKIIRKRAIAYRAAKGSGIGTNAEFTEGLVNGLEQAADFLAKGAW